MRRLPPFAVAITCSAMAVGATASPGATEQGCATAECTVATAAAAPATARITPAGAGAVKLGRTYASLRSAGFLSKLVPGCELGGPQTRAATLVAPLKGSVDLTLRSPRRVAAILVRGGATARGVGIGATSATIRRAFPRARFDHRGDAVFGLTFVRVPKSGGGRLEFGVDTKTKRVTLIGIPRIPVCD